MLRRGLHAPGNGGAHDAAQDGANRTAQHEAYRSAHESSEDAHGEILSLEAMDKKLRQEGTAGASASHGQKTGLAPLAL